MTVPEDPFARFRALFDEAQRAGVKQPDAMALATADAQGNPSVRMVLLKAVDARGFVFYTNLESRKGRELGVRPTAALCFFWEPLERQVRVEGRVEEVDSAEADVYFATRARGSQVGAWASRQSREVTGRDVLLRAVTEVEARYAGQPVPRPPYWSGYRVVPLRMEFWHGQRDRLHHRTEYTRADEADAWRVVTLQP